MSLRDTTLAAALAFVAAAPSVRADADTMQFESGFLLRGTLDGVAVGEDGSLTRSAGFDEAQGPGDQGPGVVLWDVARGPDGRVVVAGGPPGLLARRGSGGALETIAAVPDPLATALLPAAGGGWWVAGAPSGTIWRVDAEGRAEAWCETGAKYVWDLVTGRDGRVRAATGEPARLLAIDVDGDAETVFEGHESHFTAAAEDAEGRWWVSGAGRGRLYRVAPDGDAVVMYDDELEEIVAFARDGDGWVLALTRARTLDAPPRLRIRLPSAADDAGPLGDAGVAGGDDVLEGTVEADEFPSVPPGTPLGRVVRVSDDGRVETWWESTEEAPAALAVAGGVTYLGLGEPATLLSRRDGRWSRLARWSESYVTALRVQDGRSIAATSGPPRLRAQGAPRERTGSYRSPAADAGAPVRWGRLRWKTEGDVRGARFATRTGNSPVPDATWSDWSPDLTDASGSPILSPEARYLQWRVRWSGETSGRLRDVAATYRIRNRAPEWVTLEWDTPRADADRVEWRWEALDPDGDTLEIAIDWRPQGDAAWTVLASTVVERGALQPPRARRNGRLSKPWTDLPEGIYEIRGRVGDQPSQPAGAGLTRTGPARAFVVDRSPPELRWEGSRLRAVDRHSALVRVEAWEGGLPRFRLQPVDGVTDGRDESFEVRGEYTAERGWSFRAVDASGNVQEIPGPSR